jgi:hypothetical protein
MHAVSRVWSFYSYAIVPLFAGYPPMALSAQQIEGRTLIWLHLPDPNLLPAGREHADIGLLRERLTKYERRPVAPGLSLRLDVAGTIDILESRVHRQCEETHQAFLGVYHDNLADELEKVMTSETVSLWLQTPNENYQDHRPEEFLNDPERDHLIRDLILDVKHGLVA